MENAGVDVFEKFRQEAGFAQTDSEDSLFNPKVEIDKDAIDILKGKLGNEPTGIDTSPLKTNNPEDKTIVTPEYFKPYEEILTKPYDFDPDDTTDYAAEAVKKFGSDYSHLNNRESVYDHSFLLTTEKDLLNGSDEYKKTVELSQGQIDRVQYLKDLIKSKMDENPLTYTQSQFKEQMAKFFTEDGFKLNEEGERTMNQIISQSLNRKQEFENQAKAIAKQRLEQKREYKSVLKDELNNFEIAGVKLDEETKKYLNQIMSNDKLKDIMAKKTTLKDQANVEILWTLVNTQPAFLKLISQIDKRGIETGLNQKARNNF